MAFFYFQWQPQNFIRRCLVYRKEERADVLTLCEDSYLKPPINRKNSSLQNANPQTWRNMNFLSRKKAMTSLQCRLAAQTQESRPVETKGLWWQFTLWKNNVFEVEWPQYWTTLLQARDTLESSSSLSLLIFPDLEAFEEHIGIRGVRDLKGSRCRPKHGKDNFLWKFDYKGWKGSSHWGLAEVISELNFRPAQKATLRYHSWLAVFFKFHNLSVLLECVVSFLPSADKTCCWTVTANTTCTPGST